MQQSPTISCPLKTTTEIDWIGPLKSYISKTYGDPEKYNEECSTLNRLRQDMRGAGKDSTAGRDLLYRYYGQLELLDLRFPVEERGVRVSFTWYDAFTRKQTSQYSLAFEKASIIFNISAVHSCHAANQNRAEELGVRAAYHSFQAAAGMFTYINENFLHAPSTDLSRDCVKTLINIMLAQAQEVFLEKQIADGKKSGMLAKLASQAGLLYSQAVDGCQENATKGVFDKLWTTVVLVKQLFMDSLAQYLQALADSDNGNHGLSIARLELAESLASEAVRTAHSFPNNPPAAANLSPDTGPGLVTITKRHLGLVNEKLAECAKDNDYIYHQSIPSEAAIPLIPKMPAAKAIPVQELYAGHDITRIIGPDIFQKIVPMSVTESASLYDEEKAKLVRAETEKCDLANAEMVAALDYLKLPQSLKLLKNGYEDTLDVADEFRDWCAEIAAQPESLESRFSGLKTNKKKIIEVLEVSSKALDQEEAVCEKMRAKYQGEWTQQPSSRLTQTLRADIRSYREAVDSAVQSDNQLFTQYKLVQAEISEMRSAGERTGEGAVDILWNTKAQALQNGYTPNGKPSGESLLDVDDGEGGPTVLEQIERVEELLKKLNLIKRERAQVLKDLKDKVHNDDISNVLILNKKAVQNQELQLFATELEKFRPHQNRLVQAMHKQSSLMKDLTAAYGDLLQDKRIRAEQSRYEALSRQRNQILSKFKKVYQAYLDIWNGLDKARRFYTEMVETAESLDKNVETFVANRRSEGSMLLTQIEKEKGTDADRQQKKLREMMERVSIGNAPSPSDKIPQRHSHHNSPRTPGPTSPPMTPHYQQSYTGYHTSTPPPVPPPPPPQSQPPVPPPPPPPQQYQQYQQHQQQQHQYPPSQPPPQQYTRRGSYQAQPMSRRDSSQALPSPALTAPSSQQYQPGHYSSPPNMYAGQVGYAQQHAPQPYNPGHYVPPPPPPQPQDRSSYGVLPQTTYQPPPPPPHPPRRQDSGAGGDGGAGYAKQQGQGDPWAGLAGWK